MMMRYSRTNNANEVTRNTRNRTQIQLEVELVQCNNDLMVKAQKKPLQDQNPKDSESPKTVGEQRLRKRLKHMGKDKLALR